MPEDLLLTGASVEISAAAKTPTINVLAYSGGLMNVPGWSENLLTPALSSCRA